MNPNYATAHHWYALSLAWTGRSQEAIREIEQARRLDPLSARINANIVNVLCLGRQYDRAIVEARKALELEPNHYSTYEYLGDAYLQKRMPNKALTEFQMELGLRGHSDSTPLAQIALAYAAAGNRAEARKILASLKQQVSLKYVSSYWMATAYVGLDEKEEALTWLQKGLELYDGPMVRIKVDPALDPLRSDPRFQDILRRMNFPP